MCSHCEGSCQKQPPGVENYIIKQTLEIASDRQEPILAKTGCIKMT
jgi:hypothetical protein